MLQYKTDSLLVQVILHTQPFILIAVQQDSTEMDELANKQDNRDNFFEFDYFSGAYLYIRDKAGQVEAAFLNVLIPQVDCQTCR